VLKLQNVLKNERATGAGRVKSKIKYFIHTQTFVSTSRPYKKHKFPLRIELVGRQGDYV